MFKGHHQKKTHIGWDKISESHESDKELIFRKYKQLIQLSNKKRQAN